MTSEEYEWGVWCSAVNSIHRVRMTEREARDWVRIWKEEIQDNRALNPNIFSVCRRPVGEWTVVAND